MSEESLRDELGRRIAGEVLEPEDKIGSFGPAILSAEDPEFTRLINSNERLKNFYPAFSYLGRLTNLSPKEIKLFELHYDRLLLIDIILGGKGSEWKLREALLIASRYILRDSVNGWKFRGATEQVKTVRAEISQPKKKRWGLF